MSLLMAQPREGVERPAWDRADQAVNSETSGIRPDDHDENLRPDAEPPRRYVRHFLEDASAEVYDLPLWLLAAASDVPDRVVAEVDALREMNDALKRISTFRSEDVQISIALTRPSWKIIIPIR